MEGYHGTECDRASETSSFIEDEEEEEEEVAVDPEEAEELINSLDLIQSEDVKPKMQYIMTNPSFSMVTVQSEDSGITWETSSSRCSTPWASETSTTSDLYSMESSPVGCPPGKVIFSMDEGKIVWKRKHKSSNRVLMPTNLKGGQGNKKHDSSGMQRQEPRTVLGEVQGSVLNVEQMEAQDTDEEMLDNKEDLETIAEEPVKHATVISIFRESRLRKVGLILGGPVQARIQLFNSIFGGTGPAPETLEKTRIQRSSSVSGDFEQFLEASVKERLQKFSSLSEATHPKPFQRARSRNLETPSERRREQRQQPAAHSNQSYSSPKSPLEKWLTNKDDVSFENVKPITMKDKPSRFSSFGAETTLQHEERKDRQSLLETPNQVSGQSLKSCPPEEARKQQSYSPAAKTAITEQSTSVSLESDDKSEKQVLLPSVETANKKPDQSLLTASDPLDELMEQEIQSNSALRSSADFVNELDDRQSTQPILPTASMSEHPEREAQKSAVQSYLPSAPSAKSKYSTLSETRQENIIPQSSETAQSESEHILLPHSVYETEKQENECHSSTTAWSETDYSGLLHSAKKKSQKTPPPETQNVHLEKQTESEQDFSSSLQETEKQGIKLNSLIPEKIDSKYFGISYPICTETQETQKTSAVNKAVDLDHPDFSIEKSKQAESAQMEMEHPDFSYSREETEELESAQLETEYPELLFSMKETEELESAQLETEQPDFSYFREEMVESESAQLEMEHPDFSFSREEMEELESAQLETEHQEFLFSREETENQKTVPFELEQSYSPEEAEQEETAQLALEPSDLSCLMEEAEKENTTELQLVHPDISYSTGRAETQQTGYLETAHSDLPYPMNKTKQQELAQVDLDNSIMSYFSDKGEQPQPVQQDSQPGGKLYSCAKRVQGETTQLQSEHPVLSYSTGKEQKHKTSQMRVEQLDTSYSTGKTEQQEILQPKLEQADSPYSRGETAQEAVQKDLEDPEPSCFISEAEQHENVQLASENRDFSFTTGEVMQERVESGSLGLSHSIDRAKPWETAQLEQEHLLPSYSTAGSQQQQGATPLDLAQSDILYSFGRMEQQDIVQRELEQQETAQQKAMQMELEYSYLSEEPQNVDKMNLAQQETAQRELVRPSLPYAFSEQIQEEMQMEPAYPEQTFYVSTEMQEKMTQHKSEQPFLSYFSKTEQQEIVCSELEQTFLPSSSGKEAPLEMEMSSEYPDLSYSFHKAEQQEKLEHPTLPFSLKQPETAPLVMEHPDFSCDSGEAKPGNTVEQESEHPELSYSMGETQESEHLDLPGTLGEAAQDESMEVESKYPILLCSDGQKNQQETSQLDSKYPDLSFFFGKAKEQATQEFEPKHQKLPKVARKRASQATAQIESKHLDLTYSLGKADELEIAPWEMKHPDLSYSTNETNQQEVVLLDQKHRKISVDREKQQQTTNQQLEQEKLSYSPGKTEQLKYAQENLEQPDLLFSIDRPDDEMAPPETEHAEVIYPLDKAEVRQRVRQESEHRGLISPFGKAEQKTVQPDVETPHLAHSVGMAEQKEMAEPGQGHPDLPYSVFKAGGLQTAQLKPEYPGLACSLDKVQEMTQLRLEQLDVLYVHDKTEQLPPTQLELGHTDLASPADKVGQGMEHTALGCPDEGQSVSRAEYPQAAKEKLGLPDASSHNGKAEQREMAKPEPKHPDLSYSIDKTQPRSHSTGTVQQQEKVQPELEQPGDFSSSLGKEQQWESAGMQAEYPELQCSMGKTERLQNSQAKSEYVDLSFSVGTAETHKTTQPQLKEHDLLHSFVKTKQSWAAPQESEHPDISDAMGKVLHPDLSSSVSEEKLSVQLEFKQERGSYALHPEETARLKLERSMLSSSHGTAEQPNRAPLEGEFPDFLYSYGKKEQQEMVKQELEHSDLSYSTDKTQQQETTQLGLGQPDLSSCPGKTVQPQTVKVEAEHQDLLHFTGKTEQQGTAQPEVEHPDLSYSSGKVEQTQATQWKSEQPVTPHPTGKTEQQGMAHPEWELPNLSHSICKTLSQETTQMGLGQQNLTYALGKTDEIQPVQGELEHTGSLYSSGKREVLPELHPQLSYPVREIEEEATYQKSNYPDLSYSVGQQEHHEIEQPEVEEMDLSYPAGKSQHSQPAQIVLQQPELLESFGKLEEKGMAQPGFLHSLGEEKQKPASQLDLVQQGLSHSLGKREKQETARAGFMPSDFSYSTGKAEQLQMERPKSKHPDLSYSLGKAETHGIKLPDLLYSYGKAEQPQAVQLEHPEMSYFADETEGGDGVQPELQCVNLQYSVVETELPETPSVSYTFGRIEEQETAQPDFEQSDLSSSTDKAEKHETALLRAGRSEKRDTGATSSLTAQLETEQDLSFFTEEAKSQKIKPYSSLPEQTVSVPLGISHSVSETKPEGSPKSSPVTGGLSPKHLDLSYTHCKTQQSETVQPESGFYFARKEAENTNVHPHLPVAAQPETEHVILPETEREHSPHHYFHTATQLESEQLNLPYSIDKAETLESQDYLTIPSKLESEPSVPFYSVDETRQQEIPPYSKPATQYLVPTWSLAEQEKQSMQLLIPQSAQSECKHVIPPHDEKELQKILLYSRKPASLKTVQLKSMSLTCTQDQDEQESQDHLLDTEYLSSEQLRSPPKSTTEQDKQKMQPDVQKVPRLVTTESKVTAVADWQAMSSDSFVPFHTLPEMSVSVAFTDDEKKQNIPSSLSNVVGILGKQSNIVSGIYTEGEDRHEMQPYFAEQKHTSLEHLGAVSSDLVYETVTHQTQYYSGERRSLSSAETKSVCSSSDEKQNQDIPSFGIASWLAEEVKACSISPIRATEVDKQGIQLSPNEASDFGLKQFPAGSCTELTVHGTTKNKGDMFRVSDSVSSEISHRMSSETSHRAQRYDLPSLGGDNPGPEKTSIGNPTKMEAMQHLEVDKVSEVPEHYLRREEEEMEHVSTVEDSQHAPEPTEQKYLFNIISEGYEILNIHAPTHISSVGQEESKHTPDKLEYLETNPSFKSKLADDGHRALASGTTTEISESSVLGKPASHELKELVKNDDVDKTEETQQENAMLPENNNNAVLDPNNGMADMDYFEKYTLIDDKSPVKPHFERPSSLFPVTEDPNEPVEEATSFKESTEVDTLEEEFSLLEDLDEVFYGTVKGESKMQSFADAPKPLPLQKSIDISSKKVTNVDEQKSPGTPLFDSEGALERSLLFPTTVTAVNPELLEKLPALSFLYEDLYAEAVGEKTKDETPSDEESGNSNVSFPSKNSDTDDGTGIYFEKYILKDEIPSKAIGPQKDNIPEDESFSGGISVQSSEGKHKQGSGDVSRVRTEILQRSVVEREKVQVDSDIQARICKPMHAIPFGSKVILSGARSDTTEQREEENVPVETTEELPEQSSHQEYSQRVDYQGAAYQEAGNKQEERHEITAVPQMEKYVPYVRTPVEDSEDDQYTQENLSHVPTIQQTEKPDLQREAQHPDVYEDLTEPMNYDVITQEELLQDVISSEFTHEELLFEDRDSFEHVGDSYEFDNEPAQRTPVELEDSGFVVMYPEKSATNIPQVESPQRELKKAQADTYCYRCKCPISAIDKLFGEHKDHEVTTLDAAATKMKDKLGELLIALEEKSMKIEEFVSDIESLFNSVEENCKKNAELLEKQNEEMLKKVVAQYDEKSENFEEVKKMEYLYEHMVNFQQTVDSAKQTLEATAKEMEELDGFVFLNSSKELNKRLLSAMDTTLSLEKVPSAFSLFEHYMDSPGKSNQHSLKHIAVPQTLTVIPQEPNSATSTSVAVYWAVNNGDTIDCFQVYCMEEPQASKDVGALVEEYRVTVKESHCILEDLEPDHCYSVWVMAVNCTGCSLPSEKAIFKMAPAIPIIKAENCTVCWDMATVRWCAGLVAMESFTLEYCQQHSPEGEGLRSFASIKRPELKESLEPNVNYFFYLRAVNPFGTSEQTEAALISTKGTRFRLLNDTGHPALQISPDATVIRLPKKAKFTGFPSILGELLPARGRHYWETVVSACRSYRIGICYEATSWSSVLGLSDTSWCMRCCPTQTSFLYRFLHISVMSDVHVTEHPARIGIPLDYSDGRLLFFNAERGLVLFTIRYKFTDAAHPTFALEKAGGLTLRMGMELPEFVKHS
ncbi:LOW QUALITY PROTEIN: uncharacterized protein ACIBXB_005759 [Morphnus guianensis]